MRIAICPLLLITIAAAASAQQLRFDWEKLAAKATESADVTLDANLIRIASKFLDTGDKEQARVKKVVEGLKGIYVKTFEFGAKGAYTDADLETLRTQLRAPDWSRIISVHNKGGGEHVDVFIKGDPKQIAGLAIIAGEPTELSVVQIDGPIDLDSLSDLGGHFGIPKIDTRKSDAEKRPGAIK